ncbi:unnamed protein product [Hermetia illucens]|uniref:Uncharacterized protein n=1 Tax=Hermetia illucens TaxID=343691 RepID=A0A7R8Z0H6_HERIL|nr:attacin-B-like [Hermetia illucens]CAD7091038.1 unnamed protein product [Hermetia illucens]
MNIQGNAVSNPAGGQDVTVIAGRQFGSDNTNITAGAFAGGNTLRGPPNAGVFASANANGHSLSVSKTVVPGVSATTSHAASANLFRNDQHSVNAQAFSSKTKLNDRFQFKQHGAGLNYNNANGHGASIGVNKIPGFGSSMDVGARANIFQNPNTSFAVMANSRTHLSGPFQGKTNFGVSAGITRRF